MILRKTEVEDRDFLFIFQLDDEANYPAAFTPKDPADKVAYWAPPILTGKLHIKSLLLSNIKTD
ncbi:hypothetical protein DDR33_11395 [Pararcticibacter amylolyticus]|uniref:Uncharacterized protein n=1 Tax=Pararcticibacter amylolyticus TaxID=2173175 RepID=A0A2U2PH86_9SPHI|nr:hypothetical protein DDR33_11395 [Pararcticibacter amylolyticus]